MSLGSSRDPRTADDDDAILDEALNVTGRHSDKLAQHRRALRSEHRRRTLLVCIDTGEHPRSAGKMVAMGIIKPVPREEPAGDEIWIMGQCEWVNRRPSLGPEV